MSSHGGRTRSSSSSQRQRLEALEQTQVACDGVDGVGGAGADGEDGGRARRHLRAAGVAHERGCQPTRARCRAQRQQARLAGVAAKDDRGAARGAPRSDAARRLRSRDRARCGQRRVRALRANLAEPHTKVGTHNEHKLQRRRG
jgi:hypothetical protein